MNARSNIKFAGCFAAALVFAALSLPLISSGQDTNSEAVCREHLKLIGGAFRAYRLIHENHAPAKLADLYLDGLVENLGDFVCPASGGFITAASEIDAQSDYTLEPPPGTADMIAREKIPRHGSNTVLAVFGDGSIKPIRAAARQTNDQPTAAVAPPPPASTAPPGQAAPQPQPVNPSPPSFAPAISATPDANPVAPLDVNAALRQANDLVMSRRLWEALALYRRITQAQPDNLAAEMRRASLEIALGDPKIALEISRALVKSHPESGSVHSLCGLAAHCMNDPRTAREMFAEARRLEPKLPDGHFQQATAYNQRLVPEMALQHYTIAALMDPSRFYVGHYYMGRLYEVNSMPAQGLAEFEAYLRHDNASQWANLARQSMGRLQTALRFAPTPSLRAIPPCP